MTKTITREQLAAALIEWRTAGQVTPNGVRLIVAFFDALPATPSLDVERLTAVLVVSPIAWTVRRPDGAFVMTRVFESADEAAAWVAAAYEKDTP